MTGERVDPVVPGERLESANLILRFDSGRVAQTTWHGDDVTAERLALALAADTSPILSDGEELTMRKLVSVGTLRLYYGKDVGPPPWPIPRPILGVSRRRIQVGAGWRMTAHRLILSWRRPGVNRRA